MTLLVGLPPRSNPEDSNAPFVAAGAANASGLWDRFRRPAALRQLRLHCRATPACHATAVQEIHRPLGPALETRRKDSTMISRTYLDVDGVINSLNPLWGRYSPVPRNGLSVHRCNGYNIYLPNYMTELVGALDAQTEIVWCTTWEDSANQWIGPLVGLGERRVIHPGLNDETFSWKESSVLADMAANPCAGAIWIEDFGYELDQRFADANVTGIDTTLSPASVDTDERYNVLVPAHLEGLGLQIPQCDRITLEECA